MQYVVVVDGFFLEYMATKHLTLELNRSRGLDYEPLATAHVPLRQIMQGLGTGLHVAKGATYQEAEVGLCCWAPRVAAEAWDRAAAWAAPARCCMMQGLLQLGGSGGALLLLRVADAGCALKCGQLSHQPHTLCLS